MYVTVLTPATTFRLTTLSAVQAEISGNDTLFAESLIDQASAAVARYCGTIFAQQKYREIQTGEFRTQHIFLRYWPLQSVTSVMHGTTDLGYVDVGYVNTLQSETTAETNYRIESPESAMLYRRLGWGSKEEWQLDYIAGYLLPDQLTLSPAPPEPLGELLPADIERATIEAIKVWFHERLVANRVQGKTFGLTGDSITYGVQAERRALPSLAKDMLRGWQRMRVA